MGETSVRPGINEAYQDADVGKWVERFETESREIYQQRHVITDMLGLAPGMAVADVGAGTGLFTLLFAERVGPSGTVYAVDLMPYFLEHIDGRARAGGLTNIRAVQCREDSVELPAQSIDLAFVCDTYHHFEFPKSTLQSIHRALRAGGQLVVVDFERIPGVSREWILDHVRAGKDVFVAEIRSAGFDWVDEPAAACGLKENYALRFRKRG